MRRVWLSISIISAILYLLVFPGNAVIKAGAAGGLALVALQARGTRRDAGLLALALAFSTTGDVLLDLDAHLFVYGLAAFLLAHLSYICLFVRNRPRPLAPALPQKVAVLVVLVYAATLATWIVPGVGKLGVPVVFYVCALTTMVSTAILGRFEQPWVAVGAVLFLISDSLIAINKFKTPVPARDLLVGATYYLGQCGIALGYLGIVTTAKLTTSRGAAGAGFGAAGAVLGGLAGFLLRPSTVVGPLPFETVRLRGSNLQGLDGILLRPAARTSSNMMVAGIIIGAVAGWAIHYIATRGNRT